MKSIKLACIGLAIFLSFSLATVPASFAVARDVATMIPVYKLLLFGDGVTYHKVRVLTEGLAGNDFTILLNGKEELPIPADGEYSFPTELKNLSLRGNPLATVVLPESAVDCLDPSITRLCETGVAVHLAPLPQGARLVQSVRNGGGYFVCALIAPPNTYRVEVTTDFSTWTDLGPLENTTGAASFTDPAARERPFSFYRVKVE